MRWMVGVDIRGTSKGAVGFARALHRDGTGHVFGAVHVIEDKARALVAEHYPNLLEELPAELERVLAPLAAGPTFKELGVTTSTSADAGLADAAGSRLCHGMIVGRRGPSSGRALIRLGRTARRLLRHLERPTIIVPPDYSGTVTLDAPVLLATDLGPATEGAAHFAKALANSLDVDVLATSVATVPDELGQYVPRTPGFEEKHSDVRSLLGELNQWTEAHGLQEARTSVVAGSATAKLLEVADLAGVSLLVVGSRCLSASDRVFVSSLGSHLAAHSPIPIAVVPPRWRP